MIKLKLFFGRLRETTYVILAVCYKLEACGSLDKVMEHNDRD